MRKTLMVLAMCLSAVAATPVAASAAPAWQEDYYYSNSTINLPSDPFAKETGGVYVKYWCMPVAGNTQVQVVSANQLTAYRTFAAICDGAWHDLGGLNVPSNTAMRARIHNYSGNKFEGGLEVGFNGRWL